MTKRDNESRIARNLWLVAGLAAAPNAFAQTASIQTLGHVPGLTQNSTAGRMSGDGSTIIGCTFNSNLSAYEGFVWRDGILTPMGDLPGGGRRTFPNDLNYDGSVVVGFADETGCEPNQFRYIGAQAFKWTAASGITKANSAIPTLACNACQVPYLEFVELTISGDGTTVYSNVGLAPCVGGGQWSYLVLPAYERLDVAGVWGFDTEVVDIADESSVGVGGYYDQNLTVSVAARWNLSANTRTTMPELPGGTNNSLALRTTPDGSMAVGYGTSASGLEAALWQTPTTVLGLGDLPGGGFTSVATGISRNGKLVCGYGTTVPGYEGFIWNATQGMRRTQDVLAAEGVSLPEGVMRVEATYNLTIVGNMAKIVGYGPRANGNYEALLVQLPCVKITQQPSDVNLFEGGTATFTTAGASGEIVSGASLTYQWRRNGVALSDGGAVSGVTTGTLTINPAVPENGGLYDCVVSNYGGELASTGATLTVGRCPAVTKEPQAVSICMGGTAGFHVAAIGSDVSYRWLKDDVELADGPTGSGSSVTGSATDTLSVSVVGPSDIGQYRCAVSNGCGSVASADAGLAICAADFDCDGFLTGIDYDVYVAAFEAGEMSADFDGDEFLTGIDFDLYVQAFESGC